MIEFRLIAARCFARLRLRLRSFGARIVRPCRVDESGETLAETLVSLLIIAGLFACLATAVVTSAGINKKAQEQSSKNEFSYTTQDGYKVSKSSKGEVTFTFDSSTPAGSAKDEDASATAVDFYTTPADGIHDAYNYYEPKTSDSSKASKSKKAMKDSSAASSDPSEADSSAEQSSSGKQSTASAGSSKAGD